MGGREEEDARRGQGRKAKKTRSSREAEDQTQDGPGSKREWTAEEDKCLQSEVQRVKHGNWRIVCKNLNKRGKGPRRSPAECRLRWNSLQAAQERREPWTPAEKLILLYEFRASHAEPASLRNLLPTRENPQQQFQEMLLEVASKARPSERSSSEPQAALNPALKPSPSLSPSPSADPDPNPPPSRNPSFSPSPSASESPRAGSNLNLPSPTGPQADLSLLQDLICTELLLSALGGVEGLEYVQEVLQESKVEAAHLLALLEAASRQLQLLKPLTQDTLGEYLDIVLDTLQNAIYADYQGTEGLEELIHARNIPQSAPADRQALYQLGGHLSTVLMHGII